MRFSLLPVAFLFFAALARTQPLSFNFQKVTTAQGLNTSSVTAICEDKYGYLWLGTPNGLNRYDGYGVKVYEHRFSDSTSLIASAVRFLFCDSEGRLWVSFMNGLMEYDY
ncbi:MAG: two-component regulator propeller domain-containing protein, partial [Saprospiraceae bacterium]